MRSRFDRPVGFKEVAAVVMGTSVDRDSRICQRYSGAQKQQLDVNTTLLCMFTRPFQKSANFK